VVVCAKTENDLAESRERKSMHHDCRTHLKLTPLVSFPSTERKEFQRKNKKVYQNQKIMVFIIDYFVIHVPFNL